MKWNGRRAQVWGGFLTLWALLAPSVFAELGDRPRRIVFPAGADRATIPLIRAGGYLMVQATVDGQDAGLFIVDSGATMMIVDPGVAEKLKLKSIGKAQSTVIGGSGKATLTILEAGEVKIGGLNTGARLIGVAPMDNLRTFIGDKLSGLIGLDMLGEAPFSIDYVDRTLTFYPKLPEAAVAKAKPIPMKRRGGMVYVWASLEGHGGWWFMDTGKNGGMEVFAPFMKMYPDLIEGKHTLSETSFGLGGLEDRRSTVFKSFEFGGKVAPISGTYHPDLQRGSNQRALTSSGQLGSGILSGSKVTFDLAAEKAWIEWYDSETDEAYLKRVEVEAKADPTGRTVLMRALLSSRNEIARKLIERGADVNAKSIGNVRPILCTGNAELLKMLVEHGADANTQRAFKSNTAMIEMAEAGNVEAIKALAAAGGKVDHANTLGETAIARAAEADYAEVVKALIALKADINKANKLGMTPLMMAVRMESFEAATLLIEAKADLKAVSKAGLTALMYASGTGQVKMVNMLIAAGADVNAPGGDQTTPLMVAALNGMEPTARVLVEAGADISLKNRHGRTAMDMALDEGSMGVIEAMRFRNPAEKK